MRLSIVPATSPDAATIGFLTTQKKITAPPSQLICQLRNHMPARGAPIFFIKRGAIHVADNSKTVDRVRTRPMMKEVYPTETKYVTCCPDMLSMVK